MNKALQWILLATIQQGFDHCYCYANCILNGTTHFCLLLLQINPKTTQSEKAARFCFFLCAVWQRYTPEYCCRTITLGRAMGDRCYIKTPTHFKRVSFKSFEFHSCIFPAPEHISFCMLHNELSYSWLLSPYLALQCMYPLKDLKKITAKFLNMATSPLPSQTDKGCFSSLPRHRSMHRSQLIAEPSNALRQERLSTQLSLCAKANVLLGNLRIKMETHLLKRIKGKDKDCK